MKQSGARGAAFLKLMSGAVGVQIALSASNFLVGLLLIRRTSDAQYGYYVLIGTAVLLATTIQGSFIQPPMINRLTRADQPGRANLIGGLYHDQRRLVPFVTILTALCAAGLWLAGRLDFDDAAIIVAGTAAVIMALYREFFRMVLFAYRRPNDILKADLIYCLLLIASAAAATLVMHAAAAAAFGLALSALVGRLLLARALWRHEPWNPDSPRGTLRSMAHDGIWSAFGGGTHWLFSQGYSYLVAGMIDVSAVAALAATRLLVMPVSLLSVGIGTLMLPTASRWNHDHAADTVLRRLTLFAVGLSTVAGCYLFVAWLAREWIFDSVLRKHFDHCDLLLLLWSAISVVTVFRDQLLYFLVTRAQFRSTSSLTFASAVISYVVSLIAMGRMGAAGSLTGLLSGEVFNVAGIVVLSLREARRLPHSLAAASKAA